MSPAQGCGGGGGAPGGVYRDADLLSHELGEVNRVAKGVVQLKDDGAVEGAALGDARTLLHKELGATP